MYTNKQIWAYITDAVEEAARIESATSWIGLGRGDYRVEEVDGAWVGNVTTSLDCSNGCVEFNYHRDKITYVGLPRVYAVDIDAPNWGDDRELQKLVGFDKAIVDSHNL